MLRATRAGAGGARPLQQSVAGRRIPTARKWARRARPGAPGRVDREERAGHSGDPRFPHEHGRNAFGRQHDRGERRSTWTRPRATTALPAELVDIYVNGVLASEPGRLRATAAIPFAYTKRRRNAALSIPLYSTNNNDIVVEEWDPCGQGCETISPSATPGSGLHARNRGQCHGDDADERRVRRHPRCV